MAKTKGKKFKINVTGMTEEQNDFVKVIADERGSNKAEVMKSFVRDAMEKEAAK